MLIFGFEKNKKIQGENLAQNASSINSSNQQEIPSTRGMTVKVFKGSLWTLLGQVLPFAVSFFATPFVINFTQSSTDTHQIDVSLKTKEFRAFL